MSVEVVPLGDVVRPTRLRVKPAEKPDLPFVGMEHVEAHTMKLLGTVPANTMKSAAVHFKAGDVLYGRLRPYLNKVYRPAFEGLCSAEFIVLPETPRIDGGYLQYFLHSPAFANFASHLNAGDRPRVDFDQLASFGIPLPPLDKQRSIVAEIEKQFSRLDEATSTLQRTRANLRRYKAAILNAAATGGFGEGRAPSTSDICTLGAIADVIDPNPTHRMPKYVDEGYPFISSENFVGDDGIDFGKGKRVCVGTMLKQRQLFEIEDGDFVLSRIGTIGKTRALPPNKDFCLSHALVLIRVKTDRVDKRWLRLAISSERVLSQARRGIQSVGVPDLGMGKIRSFEVMLPPVAVQRRIAAEVERRLSIARELEVEVEANLNRAQALRHAALSRAFS